MTRRERLEAKIEKREQWAQSREAEAHRRFEAASKDAEAFSGGQPILVGHHSEKGARRLQDKIHKNGFAAIENLDMAEHHRDKATGLQHQLNNSIFSDDEDAVEQIEEKIADLEKAQEYMTAVNKICRNKKLTEDEKVAAIVARGVSQEKALAILHPLHHWQSVGFESFMLSNNRANITRYTKRLAVIKAQAVLRARAESAASGVVVDRFGERIARVTFAEKPEREIISALKAAGFYWSSGCWRGEYAKLPASVLELVNQ